MEFDNTRFDVAIIGSGIAGSTLGAILARQGMQVILFEGSNHPRFAIGESMILETSEVMRSMAELYDVPELAYFSSENYFDHIGTSHGVKRHFSYLHHTEGEPLDKRRTLQAVIPKEPHGHELHLYRQDTDYFLMTMAVRYGAKVLQKTRIQSVEIDANGVQLTTEKGQQFEADYVVDAGGFRSLLAQKFDLRHHNLQTHSRAIFTHMVEVPCYHQVSAEKSAYGLPFQLSEGTLHHVFDGGWLWVIPFDNHAKSTNPLCSVGLMLDPRVHPLQSDLSPEEEFYQFIGRFPSIAAQFHQARAVRDWTRTGRIQYGTKQVVGDRYCLLGQAAGFIDPLFSKGLYTALSCTSVLANQLLTAKATGDYSAAHFQPLEKITQAFIHSNDQLVANAYRSFSDYRLWAPFSALWLLGAYLELVKLTSSRALAMSVHDYYQRLQTLKMVGGGFPDFEQLSQEIYGLLAEEIQAEAVGQKMKDRLQQVTWMPHAFRAVLKGKNHLPTNKLHPRLLLPKHGFLGQGDYRAHFFDDKSLHSLARFFVREKATYATPILRLKRSFQLWQRGILHLPVRTATIAALIISGGLVSYGPRALRNLPITAMETTEQHDTEQHDVELAGLGELELVGLGSLLDNPTDFQVACGSHTGTIVEATVNDNYLMIEIAYPSNAKMHSTTLSGHLDKNGIFLGSYQTHWVQGTFSGDVLLSFAADGSAHGIHQGSGRTLAIQRVVQTQPS